MAEPANSIAAPAGAPPSLWRLRGLFLFADSAREVVTSTEADDKLDAICDHIITRMIARPVSSGTDALAKLWLLDLAGEREWDHHYCARPVIGELIAFVERKVA